MKNSLIWKSIGNVMRRNKGVGFVLLLTIVLLITASLLPPQILRLIIDGHLVPKKSQGLLTLGILYMGMIFLNGALEFLKEVLLTVLGQKITSDIRKVMMEKLGRVRSAFFSKEETGVIVSKMTNDVDSVNAMFTSGIISMFIDSLKVIGIILSIWIFSARLGFITLLILPVIFLIIRVFQKRMLKAQMDNRILTGKVNNHIDESLRNVSMIKSFSIESYMEKRYRWYLLQNFRTIEKSNFYDSIFSPIIQLMKTIVIAVIALLSVLENNYLGISIGMVAAAIELITNLFSPVENIGMELQGIQQAVSGIRRVNEFYDEPEEKAKDMDLKTEDIIRDREKVTLAFTGLTFGYEEEEAILKDITLEVRPMEKVSLAGRTGVGKSTMFKLVMGLLNPDKGSITINGVDVTRIPNREKRKIFGYVEQDFHLIQGTLREQITLKDEEIREEDVQRAIQISGLWEYLADMPEGLDMQITSRSFFSSGQLQLLSIARAVAADPPILLLDEITANLDSVTEEKVLDVLQRSGEKRMILSISHRLSSMLSSDRVVILEGGRIISEGAPDRLLREDEWMKARLTLENLTWN